MAFDVRQLESYLEAHELTPLANRYIRDSADRLWRNVGTAPYTSVVTEFQSQKMGVTVNTESRSGELSYALHLEFREDVIGYFEQSPPVDVVRHTKRGVAQTKCYIPDFVVLQTSEPCVIQVKAEVVLHRNCETRPMDWVRRGDFYVDIPAEAAFAEIGLKHRVVSTAELCRVRTANLRTLLQARRSISSAAVSETFRTKCCRYVSDCGLVTLQDLAKRLGVSDYGPLIILIADGLLITDLSRALLTEPSACIVATDSRLLTTLVEQARSELLINDSRSLTGKVSRAAVPARKEHLLRALEKLEVLKKGGCSRSVRRWRAQVHRGSEIGLSALAALVDRYHKSGNRAPKRPADVLNFCATFIESEWPSDNAPSLATLFREYKRAAKNQHPIYKFVSKPTFLDIFAKVEARLARARGGTRAGNAAEPPSPPDSRVIRPSRPFELATCDHYLTDINCVVMQANGTYYVQRPWLTVLRDVATGYSLCVWLSLRSPSRMTCAMIIRLCLRKWGRLPEALIIDRGAEFRSVYFSQLLAHCEMHLSFRPSGHPRYGSEAERFFGQFKNFWLSSRAGNIVSVREARSVSGCRKPEKLAQMEVRDLLEELLDFSDWHSGYCTDSISKSPQVQLNEGLTLFAFSGIQLSYDDSFVVSTAVDVDQYTLDPQRGLHIGPNHYWHSSLKEINWRHEKVEVRKDPEDPYAVYALVHDEWVTCRSTTSATHSLLDPLTCAARGILAIDGARAHAVAKEDAEFDLTSRIDQWDAKRLMVGTSQTSEQNVRSDKASNPLFEEVELANLSELDVAEW